MRCVPKPSPICRHRGCGPSAQALVALDAAVELVGPGGLRVMPFEALHRTPGETPHVGTNLARGELILGFVLPVAEWTLWRCDCREDLAVVRWNLHR